MSRYQPDRMRLFQGLVYWVEASKSSYEKLFISWPNLLIHSRTFIILLHVNGRLFWAEQWSMQTQTPLQMGDRGELGLETEVLSGMMAMDFTREKWPWNGDFRIDWDPEL